jgi:hypothetical protein
VSLGPAPPAGLIWATRGRSWGFRFLLDAGLPDPLPDYERAFADLDEGPTAWRREAGCVALRIPDPLGRRDTAGRVIPHEFVIFGVLADSVESVGDGVRVVWPLVAAAYAGVWNADDPPAASELRFDSR